MTKTISSAEYPDRGYIENFKRNSQTFAKFNLQNASLDTIKRKIASVAIYYDYLGYNMVKEVEEMLISELISNIGGNLFNFVETIIQKFIQNFFS